jgi:hypothetical protein
MIMGWPAPLAAIVGSWLVEERGADRWISWFWDRSGQELLSSTWITRMSVFCSGRCVAKLCRSVCSETGLSISAIRAAAWQARLSWCGVSGLTGFCRADPQPQHPDGLLPGRLHVLRRARPARHPRPRRYRTAARRRLYRGAAGDGRQADRQPAPRRDPHAVQLVDHRRPPRHQPGSGRPHRLHDGDTGKQAARLVLGQYRRLTAAHDIAQRGALRSPVTDAG